VTVPFSEGGIVRIPTGAIVVTVGAPGAGKSSWVARNFDPEQVLALDEFRRIVAGSDTDMDVGVEALDLLLAALDSRARRQITTVVDGQFTDPVARRRVLEVAARHGRPATAVCFVVSPEVAEARIARAQRWLSPRVLRRHVELVDEFCLQHPNEGWAEVTFLGDDDEEKLPVVRVALPASLPFDGPFDVIGDVHGCLAELDALLDRLGYAPPDEAGARRHPAGRLPVFVGDFADRGPDSAGVFRRVLAMHDAAALLAVPGNHCLKLLRWLEGKPVDLAHGLGSTVEQLAAAGPELQARVRAFLVSLPRVLVLAGGRLVVFHAALALHRVGRADQATLAQTAWGIVRGTDEYGLPVRDTRWTATWKTGPDEPFAVYGHSPVRAPLRLANTLDLDGGCCFGGYLAAYRWPEDELVCVPALRAYAESPKVDWRGCPPHLG